jgi:hypothetical protein
LAARAADGWVPSLTGDVQAVADMTRRLDDAAAGVGRDPAEIRRILNVSGTITDGSSDGSSGGVLNGPVEHWVDELTDLAVTHGFDTFVLWADGDDQLPRFAEGVVPAGAGTGRGRTRGRLPVMVDSGSDAVISSIPLRPALADREVMASATTAASTPLAHCSRHRNACVPGVTPPTLGRISEMRRATWRRRVSSSRNAPDSESRVYATRTERGTP